jgi:hypothetical protein
MEIALGVHDVPTTIHVAFDQACCVVALSAAKPVSTFPDNAPGDWEIAT